MKRLLINTRLCAGIVFLSLFLINFLFACTSPQTNQLKQERPEDLPTQAKIDNVPFFPQEEFHCGPSTLAMAMKYYGINITPTEIAKDVFTPGMKGSFQVEMKAAARKRGMLAYQLTPELVYLLAEVSVGHPVIVLQNLSVKLYPVWHYALVIGYDLDRNSITLHTGANDHYEVSLSTFERTWQRSENWALVLLPTDRLPNDRNKLNILQAAVELEQVGKLQHANTAYQTILNRWPENITAIMGTGNTYLQLNQPKQASHWYFKAIEINPERAEIYNNLAYSLLAQDCRVAALASIKCALKLEPSNSNYKNSYLEISNSKTTLSQSTCPSIKCPK